MNVSLTPELEEFVASKVRQGLFRSHSEVIRQGLRLLIERERLFEARIADLKGEIGKALGEARRGELLPAEEVEARLRRRAREKAG